MPIQIYRRQNNPDNAIGDAILAGTQGFVQGRKMKQDSEDRGIANAYRQAQIDELKRKSQIASQAVTTDPASGQPLFVPSPNGNYVTNPSLPKKVTPIDPEAIKQKEIAKGIPVSETGKYTFAQEAEANLPQALSTLFPTGKPESFRRDYAFASRTPGPKFLGGGKALPLSKEGQNVKRWLGSALAGRLLIQSGAQTNPAEYERLADDYLASVGSDPAAIQQGINELLAFHQGYQKNLKTRGAEGYQAPSYSGLPTNQPPQSAGLPQADPIEQEAQAAIAAGKDPALVNQRLQQLRGRRG